MVDENAGEASAGAQPPTYDELILAGRLAFERQESARARHAFQGALALNGEGIEAQQGLCRLAYREQDWPQLHERASHILRHRPENREALLLRARADSGRADWAGAARDWGLVAEDRPDWPEARFQQARAEIRRGDLAAARLVTDALLAMEGAASEPQAYGLRLLIELNAFAEAKAVLDRLFRTEPALAAREFDLIDKQNLRRALAVALRSRRDALGVAVAYDEKPLMVSEALFRSALGHERADDLLEAFFDYDALLVLSPDDGLAQRSRLRVSRALRVRAEDDLAAEAFVEAAGAFARAVRTAPGDVSLRRTQGRLLMRLRDWTEAIPVWREVLRRVPSDPEATVQLARALDRSGRLADAVAAWRDVQEVTPNHDEATRSLATMARRMTFAGRTAIADERFVDANALFKAVLIEDPANEEAPRRLEQVGRNLLKRMRAAHKAREPRAVMALAAAATERLPGDTEVHLLVGRAASSLRRYPEAVAAWTRLAAIDPGQSVLANLQIARCHLAQGAAEAGRAAIGEVLAAEPANVEAGELLERLGSLT